MDLTGFETDDQDKKLRFVFNFNEAVEAQVVNNYANNFVDIGIADLTVPRNLTKQDQEISNAETAQFCRFTRFMEIDGERHIRIYLGKYADPSDVQVVVLDNRIEVEMVKPFWKVPVEDTAADTPEEPAAGDAAAAETTEGFIPDETGEEPVGNQAQAGENQSFPAGYRDAAGETPDGVLEGVDGAIPADSTEDQGESDEWADAPEGQSADIGASDESAGIEDNSEVAETAVTTEQPGSPTGSGELYGQTSLDDLAGRPATDTTAGAETGGAELRPVRDLTGTPSYRQFDLDDVPVAQVQLRNLPFNEALMELVAGSGFNVVIGSEVSDEVMTLDFRQKEVSLKRALDLLCMAYGLTYIVEDDAIIVNQK